MRGTPKISIVVCSYNQRRFLAETMDSLLIQGYPNLEIVVQDGGSTDGSVDLLRSYELRHPGLISVVSERDRGQADALNKGFKRTTGEILGFINSDDTLYPGTLASVAREIDPERGRHVVVGRCLFTGDGERYVGAEHPSLYTGHFDMLAIWKRGYNTIPQPSTFWHREVWERCGGFSLEEKHALDYDLFCRFSRRYALHTVDELWSTYRMHAESKSAQKSEEEVLALSVAVSRKYWGPLWSPLRWRLQLSHWWHDRGAWERSRRHAREADSISSPLSPRKWWHIAASFCLAPSLAWQRYVAGASGRWLPGPLAKVLLRPAAVPEFVGRHGDGWIGPRFRQSLERPAGATKLVAVLEHVPAGTHQKLQVRMLVDGREVASLEREAAGQFALVWELGSGLPATTVSVEITSSSHFVPRVISGTPDDRKLSVQLHTLAFEVHP